MNSLALPAHAWNVYVDAPTSPKNMKPVYSRVQFPGFTGSCPFGVRPELGSGLLKVLRLKHSKDFALSVQGRNKWSDMCKTCQKPCCLEVCCLAQIPPMISFHLQSLVQPHRRALIAIVSTSRRVVVHGFERATVGELLPTNCFVKCVV